MTSLPTVASVMLVRDRPAMADQAIKCWHQQTYNPHRRWLVVYDTGDPQWFLDAGHEWDRPDLGCILYSHQPQNAHLSIGMLRNEAMATHNADISVTWDSDDWSSPEKIAEQVALLQSLKADCVGYSDMLFWDSRPGHFCGAWLYTATTPRTPPGASLCYWRTTWGQKPFANLPRPGNVTGEDYDWVRNLNVATCSSIVEGVPRMICRVHSGNTSQQYSRSIGSESPNWKRAPEFDEYCRGVFDDSRS